ncbi:MAG: IS200/IS605 family transposase [Opitutales bacterium]
MGNSYSQLSYHLVFSTRNRERWIDPAWESDLWAYLAGVAKQEACLPLKIGGIEDHLHCLIRARPSHAPARLVQILKTAGSRWIHQTHPHCKAFRFQEGYGAFTVSRSMEEAVMHYISGQREHHRTVSFADEFRSLLKRHAVRFDERYLLG